MVTVKLICCDVDGTLVRNDKRLSEQNIRWIQKAYREKKVPFVLVTGRMRFSVRYLQEALAIKGCTSCLNGCVLYNEQGDIIMNHTISSRTKEKIVKASLETGIDTLFIHQDEWYTTTHTGYLYEKKRPLYQKDSHRSALEESLMMDVNKYLVMSKEEKKLDAFATCLQAKLEDEKEVTFYRGNDFIELMPRGINKGTAIQDLSHYYKVDTADIMAIGDDENDLEMLQIAGVSVAMENATSSVLHTAKYGTVSNEQDGVAHAIEQLLFP